MKKLLLAILSIVSATTLFAESEKGYRSEDKVLFGNGTQYRIPSLLVTKTGRVLAAADKRFNSSVDWNNIDTVLRISDDGLNFKEEKTIIDLAEHTANATGKQYKSAFLIDPSLLDADDKIFMLVDMFPKSSGFFSVANADPGTGYETIGRKNYLKINKFGDNAKNYYLDNDGLVYERPKNNNNATIVKSGNLWVVTDKLLTKENMPFKQLGDIYDGENKIGNIYRGKVNGEVDGDFDGEYSINPTSYLWLTKSTDNGETWDVPIDINPMVKKDFISFMGTGPGIGIKLKKGEHKGRLLFPVYYTTKVVKNDGGRDDGRTQQSALVYSDDDGKTWTLSESIMENRIVGNNKVLNEKTPALGGFQLTESQVVELNNGTLKLFMRGYHNSVANSGGIHIGTSYDGGHTWEDRTEEVPFEAPYCQVAAIHIENVGNEEFVVVSAPSNRAKRENNKLHLGKVTGDKIEWIGERQYTEGGSAYSSIARLLNGDIATLYEGNGGIRYTTVSLDWIAPNYVFKEFLPRQKEATNNTLLSNILSSNSNSYNLDYLNDLNTDKTSFKYVTGKNNENITHLAEVYSPVYKNIGVYSRLAFNGKDINTNVSGYVKFEDPKKIVSGYQTFGMEYYKRDVEFHNAGYDINMPINYFALRGLTNLKFYKYEKDNFSITPNLTVDLQYMPYTKTTAKNHEDITYSLSAKNLLSVNSKFGITGEYKNKFVNLALTPTLKHYGVLAKVENQSYTLNRLGYGIDLKAETNIIENLTLLGRLNYSNYFKSKNFGTLKGGLEVNYKFF